MSARKPPLAVKRARTRTRTGTRDQRAVSVLFRPVSTFATAADRLSYRTCRHGTPPVTSNAVTCPSKKASCAQDGIHAVHRPAGKRQPVGEQVTAPATSPASTMLTGPKSTSASAPGLLGLRHEPRHAPRRRPLLHLDLRPPRPRVLGTHTNTTPASPCSSASRCQIRRAVCRCLRGASRSSRSIASISSATESSTGDCRSRRLARRRHRRGQRLPHHPPVHPVPASQRPDP